MSDTQHEVLLITRGERAWHGLHALSVTLLILTGFHIHFPQSFALFGSLKTAMWLHEVFGIIFVLDLVFFVLYQLKTKRIKFFIPNREDLPVGVIRQALYYGYGIFKRAPHPYEADGVTRKFNPMQKMAYLNVMFGLIPLQALTGVVLFVYVKYWDTLTGQQVHYLSLAHILLAFFVSSFVLGHLYLATTGDTPLAHFKTIINGKHTSHHH